MKSCDLKTFHRIQAQRSHLGPVNKMDHGCIFPIRTAKGTKINSRQVVLGLFHDAGTFHVHDDGGERDGQRVGELDQNLEPLPRGHLPRRLETQGRTHKERSK